MSHMQIACKICILKPNMSNVAIQYFFFALYIYYGTCQLIVNVQNGGGEVYQESIFANKTADTVTLEWRTYDGSLYTQLLDFTNEVQIFRAIVLGEEELRQSQFHVWCFVSSFQKADFISPDAMSKLRQKNPSAIRTAEEDKGLEQWTADAGIIGQRAFLISPHVNDLCEEGPRTSVYTRMEDLAQLRYTGKQYKTLQSAALASSVEGLQPCHAVTEMLSPCLCRLQTCIGWYPCGLKYCHGKDSSGKVVTYRCGIKTCKKCRSVDFHVTQRNFCMWDTIE